MRRRYESWFLRLGLADGSGAWWFRYLLTNPGQGGCPQTAVAPAQVWATWFPCDGKPESFIQGFPLEALKLGSRRESFDLEIGGNGIAEDRCFGALDVAGRKVSWDLGYRSHFNATISHKGWIGFSRTPHSDVEFSGEIRLDDRIFRGEKLGLGVQGHNCGFRHRCFWTWTHACFPQGDGSISTFEALIYEMPFGLVFRRAVLWHRRRAYIFRKLKESRRDRKEMKWVFTAQSSAGTVKLDIDGGGISVHRLPYAKTDCSGTFEVSNNSRARCRLNLNLHDCNHELSTEDGCVLEMTGEYN